MPANHVVPAVGFHLDSGRASLVFTGDTTTNDALWPEVNQIANLRYLIIETALSDRERDLALASKHLCPSLLAEELAKLKHSPQSLHHAPEAARVRADHAGSRHPGEGAHGRRCCRTTRYSNFDDARARDRANGRTSA